MSETCESASYVIPLSIQKEGDSYLVGNAELGDFYQFPEEAVAILNMLQSGDGLPDIQRKIRQTYRDPIDVEGFVDQLSSIGFLHPHHARQAVQERLAAAAAMSRRVFSVDPNFARAVFSPPVLVCCGAIVIYALAMAVIHPALRVNINAFYIETNRTPLMAVVFAFTVFQTALHEGGHMLAAARHGIRSRYGVGTRMWIIVAESDLTGILALPRSQRYFPMLAGILVDVVCTAILTVILQILMRHGVHGFFRQMVQAMVLSIVVSIPWQFDIFVKTDIYYVVCTYFGHADLDRDARAFLLDLIHRASFGRFGLGAGGRDFGNPALLRIFSAIWLVGRSLSVLVLACVFAPTMVRYAASAIHMLNGPSTSLWHAFDTLVYVTLSLTMFGTGLYMWVKQTRAGQASRRTG